MGVMLVHSAFDRFMGSGQQGGNTSFGFGLLTGSGWNPVQVPPPACRLIRPQTFLGTFGNCTGPLTYGPDKDLLLRDKELFRGLSGSPSFVFTKLDNVKCNPYTDVISC